MAIPKNTKKFTTREQVPSSQHPNLNLENFPNKKYGQITLPILQMSYPYYPYSHLASSTFFGYYFLFFMYSTMLVIIYPILNFIKGQDLYDKTIIKLVETNITWDIISTLLFIFMALIFTQMSILQLPYPMILISAVIIFIGGPLIIVKSYNMYFTDRIFIIVLGAALGAKATSYLFDKSSQLKMNQKPQQWIKIQKQKQIYKLSKRLLFFISPIVSYHKFVMQHDSSLKINKAYISVKFLVSFLCLFANNIITVKFIEPACESDLMGLALFFKLIPLTFYINMILYYMVFDNVLAAVAEITQIKYRVFYLDWWNAKTIFQFLQKWCLLLTDFTDIFIPKYHRKIKNTVHVLILLILLLIVFGRSLTLLALVIFILILCLVYFFGGMKQIQNNYIVHILCMSFTPLLIVFDLKIGLFA